MVISEFDQARDIILARNLDLEKNSGRAAENPGQICQQYGGSKRWEQLFFFSKENKAPTPVA